MSKTSYRSIWISDVHLGFHACHADRLLDFLKSSTCANLYLVGDIFDIWQFRRRRWQWTKDSNELVRRVLKMSRHSRVIFVPGNHDEDAREFCGHVLGNIEIACEAEHVCLDGRRFLVTHGDQFDMIVQNQWLTHLGAFLYDYLIILNKFVNGVRRFLRLRPWSLSAYLKRRTKQACAYVSSFEHALGKEARDRGFDGVVCGHIHHAEARTKDGFTYCNAGDWVENCSVLVEHHSGELEVLRFPNPV